MSLNVVYLCQHIFIPFPFCCFFNNISCHNINIPTLEPPTTTCEINFYENIVKCKKCDIKQIHFIIFIAQKWSSRVVLSIQNHSLCLFTVLHPFPNIKESGALGMTSVYVVIYYVYDMKLLKISSGLLHFTEEYIILCCILLKRAICYWGLLAPGVVPWLVVWLWILGHFGYEGVIFGLLFSNPMFQLFLQLPKKKVLDPNGP